MGLGRRLGYLEKPVISDPPRPLPTVDNTLLLPKSPPNEDRFICDSAQGLLAETLKGEIHRQLDAMSEEVSLSKEMKETVEPLRVKVYVPTVAYAQPHGLLEFIAGTGTSFFVLPEENVSERMRKRIHTLAKPLAMATVNGLLTVSEAINVGVPNLDRSIEFIVVKDSPPLLSVGRLCMLEGLGFYWPPRKTPWLISPAGKRIHLSVHDFVPYCPAAKPNSTVAPDPSVAQAISAFMAESERRSVTDGRETPKVAAGPSDSRSSGGDTTLPMDREEPAVTGDVDDASPESSDARSHKPNGDGAHDDVLPDAADTEAGVPALEDRMNIK